MDDEEILKDCEKRDDKDFCDLITMYSEDIKQLMVLARQDEREQLSKPTSIGSCRVCGMDDAVPKAYERGKLDGWEMGVKGMTKEAFEKGKQAGREEMEKEIMEHDNAVQSNLHAKIKEQKEKVATLEREIAIVKEASVELLKSSKANFEKKEEKEKENAKLREALEKIAVYQFKDMNVEQEVMLGSAFVDCKEIAKKVLDKEGK